VAQLHPQTMCSLFVASYASESDSESYFMTDVQSTSLSWNKASVWGLRLNLYCCQTVAVLLMWSALSDERTDVAFIIAPGPHQRSHFWVRRPWVSLPYVYFTLSDSRLPLSSLLRLAGLRWRYSTSPPHGSLSSMIALVRDNCLRGNDNEHKSGDTVGAVLDLRL
jgi:hypothetical protein